MESKSALPNKKRGLVWGVCFVVTIVVAIFSVFGFPIETKRNSGSQNETFEQAKKTAEEVVNVEIEDTNFVGGGFSVLSNANITATNCTFDDSSIVVEGDLTLEDCVVSGVGINASGRSLSITNTTIEECVDDAIFASGTSLTIEKSQILNNAGNGVSATSTNVSVDASTIKGNTGNGISLLGGSLLVDAKVLGNTTIQECGKNGIFVDHYFEDEYYLTKVYLGSDDEAVADPWTFSGNISNNVEHGVCVGINVEMHMDGGEISQNGGSGIFQDEYTIDYYPSIYVSNVNIFENDTDGVYLNTANIVMSACNISNNGGCGICGDSEPGVKLYECIVENNASDGVNLDSGNGFWFSMGSTSILSNGGYGLRLLNPAYDMDVLGTISGNQGGIFCEGYYDCLLNIGDGSVVSNNILKDENSRGGNICSIGGNKLSIAGTTISGGKAGKGAGIYCDGELTLADVEISGNEAYQHGGGIYIEDVEESWIEDVIPSLYGTNLRVTNNKVVGSGGYGGGIFATGLSNLTILSGEISENAVEYDGEMSGYGGGLSVQNTPTFLGTDKDGAFGSVTMTENSAYRGGAVVAYGATTLKAQSGYMAENSAKIGGFAYATGAKAEILIQMGTSVQCNAATSYGGAIALNKSTLTIDGGGLSRNYIYDPGKTVYGEAVDAQNGAKVYLKKGSIRGDVDDLGDAKTLNGGGISLRTDSLFEMLDGSISDCFASSGGAIWSSASTVNIYGGNINYNTAHTHGGGIYGVNSTICISNTTSDYGRTTSKFFDNVAVSGGGGAVCVKSSTLEIGGDNTQITGNVGTSAGAIHVTSGSTLNFNSGTISENCSTGTTAGGVHVSTDCIMNMRGGTISNNICGVISSDDKSFDPEHTYAQGGGLYVTNNAVFTMTGGVIANNIANPLSTKESIGGNVFVQTDGHFVFEGGEISGDATTLQAVLGGGIGGSGDIKISGGTIKDCVATFGGAIGNYGGFVLTLIDPDNNSTYDVDYVGQLAISGSPTISGNVAQTGNGIFSSGDVTLDGNVEIADMIYLAGVQLVEGAEANGELAGMSTTHAIPKITLSGTGEAKYKIKFVDAIFDVFDYAIRIDGSSNANTLSAIVGAQADGHSNDVKSEIASFSGEGEVDFLSMLDFFDIDETAFAKAVIDGSLHLFEDGTTLVYVSCNDDGIRVEQGTGTGYLLNGTNQATEIEVSDDFVVYGIMTEGFKGLGVTQILMPVTANTKIKVVGESAFADCTNLELVELTGENFAIDASVFDGCTSLNYIKFLGCGSIEDGAFDGVSLSNITLSGDGLEIGQSTFLSSKLTLESLEVGKIKSVGERSFYNFQALLTAVVNAENIGSYAFAESQKLSEVNVVDNGEFDITLGDKVFYACPLLERASIGCRETAFASETENSISLGVDVFRDCPVLSSAVIGNAVKTIPEGLFRSCVMLREVSLPLSFDSIAFAAFYQAGKDISWGDYGLEIVLPTDGSLKSINRRAFMQSAIGGLLLPESVETIGEGAFGSCANLSGEVRIPNSVTTLGASSFANDSKITALIIGTGISSLSTTVFAGCTGITSLTVNGQIEGGISASMFGECRNLEILTTASDVAANGFLDKTNLLSLAFLNGVQRIGASAFECCYGIRGAIYLPDSLVEIDDDAFYACDSITSIRLSPNIEEISSGVFSCCSILENVNWSELGCLRQIANSAFECTGLVSIELPSGLETIGEYAFVDCAILSGDLLIPSSVETIADGAFAGTALTNVFASDQDTSSLVMIGYACFERCASLTSATIVGNGCAIGASVFANCSALESVSFKGVLSLDESVFTGDTLLNVCIEGVIDDGQVFASGVTITSETFIGSKETLETLSLVCKNVTGSAFNGFTNLKTISKLNAETIGSYAFANCNALEGELEIISNNIGETGGRAFYECNSLAKVTAASVEVLGPLTFNSCDNLAEVNIGGTYSIVPDRIFNSCASLQKVVLNDSYTSIAYRAFNGCSSLTSFVVADGVSSIGDEAFNGCSGLTQADIDCAITTVPVKLFSGCSSLQTVTMPSNVTDIYFGAFHGCSALSQINLPDTLQKIHARAFMGAGLTALTIPASVTEIGTAFTNSSGTTYSGSSFRSCPITSLTVNTSALTISLSMFGGYSSLQTLSTASSVAADGFQDITSLKSLFFKAGVTSIGASAFSGCTELTSLSFTSSITTIGESAFSGCTGVSGSLSLSNVTSLGAGAFQNCSSITGATLSTELTAIPSFLFSGCSKLETTNLSSLSSLTSIGESAFANCCELVTIEIPDSVTSIGECAFYYCLKLEEVFIPKSVTDIGESAFVQLASDELIYVEAESKPAGWHEYWGLVSWILYGATKTEFREDGVVKVYCLQVYRNGTGDFSPVLRVGTTYEDLPYSVSGEIYTTTKDTITCGFFSDANLRTPFVAPASDDFDRETVQAYTMMSTVRAGSAPGYEINDEGLYFTSVNTMYDSYASSELVSGSGTNNYKHEIVFPAQYVVNDTTYDVVGLKGTKTDPDTSTATEISVVFPNKLKTIGYCSFYGLQSFEYASIPDNVETIKESAFDLCEDLNLVWLGNGVTSIEIYAFAACNLAAIFIPKSVVSMGEKVFVSQQNSSLTIRVEQHSSAPSGWHSDWAKTGHLIWDGTYTIKWSQTQ